MAAVSFAVLTTRLEVSLTVSVKACVASGADPLAATIVSGKTPPVLGMPLRTPDGESVTPAGRELAVVKIGAGLPLAVKVNELLVPAVNVAALALVICGSTGCHSKAPMSGGLWRAVPR